MDAQLIGDGAQAHPLKKVHQNHLPLPLGQLGLDGPVQKAAVFLALALVVAIAKTAGQIGVTLDIFDRNVFAHDSPPCLILTKCV